MLLHVVSGNIEDKIIADRVLQIYGLVNYSSE